MRYSLLTGRENMNMESYTEQLMTRWGYMHGLIPLHITVKDSAGDTRLWWFFNGEEPVSPTSGLCDEEVITFFSNTETLTREGRRKIDEEHASQ